jgi:pyruvate formate lyase activating enzyme
MMDYPETPYETLKDHYDIAKRSGLNYVYIGNVPGNQFESTYCPKCGALVIGRYGLQMMEWKLDKDNRCPSCKTTIPIVGKPSN